MNQVFSQVILGLAVLTASSVAQEPVIRPVAYTNPVSLRWDLVEMSTVQHSCWGLDHADATNRMTLVLRLVGESDLRVAGIVPRISSITADTPTGAMDLAPGSEDILYRHKNNAVRYSGWAINHGNITLAGPAGVSDSDLGTVEINNLRFPTNTPILSTLSGSIEVVLSTEEAWFTFLPLSSYSGTNMVLPDGTSLSFNNIAGTSCRIERHWPADLPVRYILNLALLGRGGDSLNYHIWGGGYRGPASSRIDCVTDGEAHAFLMRMPNAVIRVHVPFEFTDVELP